MAILLHVTRRLSDKVNPNFSGNLERFKNSTYLILVALSKYVIRVKSNTNTYVCMLHVCLFGTQESCTYVSYLQYLPNV